MYACGLATQAVLTSAIKVHTSLSFSLAMLLLLLLMMMIYKCSLKLPPFQSPIYNLYTPHSPLFYIMFNV